MDRLTSLFNRFDDEANEELFPICTSLIAKLYAGKPAELHLPLLDYMIDLSTSAATYKRLISAAILEKVLDQIDTHNSQISFVFETSLFSIPRFFEEQENDKKGKGKPKSAVDVEELLKINLATASFETLKKFIGRKENMLYSKSESKIERNEKQNPQSKKCEEIDWLDENLTCELAQGKDMGLPFLKKEKKDPKKLKKDTLATTESAPACTVPLPVADPTSLPEVLFRLACYWVFNPKWEIRHGGLLIFRAIQRRIS